MASATSCTGATGQPSQRCAWRCQRGPTFHGGQKRLPTLCLSRTRDLNGGQALASLRHSEPHEVKSNSGRIRGTKFRQSAGIPRAPLATTSLAAASHKPVGDRHTTRCGNPVKTCKQLQPHTSQRGTTSQGRLDRPPQQPEQSPYRDRPLPGTSAAAPRPAAPQQTMPPRSPQPHMICAHPHRQQQLRRATASGTTVSPLPPASGIMGTVDTDENFDPTRLQ